MEEIKKALELKYKTKLPVKSKVLRANLKYRPSKKYLGKNKK